MSASDQAAPAGAASGSTKDAQLPPSGQDVNNSQPEDALQSEGEEEDDDVTNLDTAGGQAGGEDAAKKKKKKNKKKKSKAKSAAAPAESDVPVMTVDARENEELMKLIRGGGNTDQVDIRKALQSMNLLEMLESQLGGQKEQEHKFWNTQPVQQHREDETKEGPIDEPKTPADIRQEPLALPAGFVWSTVDVLDEKQMNEVHDLLTDHYVEDQDAMFRFRYSKEFLRWALTPPGWVADWHIGVRVEKTGKLVAFISGIQIELRARTHTYNAGDVNFLCVHKKLRSKRLAPVLIKEVTRRINLCDIWQAIYTAGALLPTPFATCRYYHRNLNPPKLVDIGFSPVPRGSTVARLVRQYNVGTQTSIPGWREMTPADVPQVGALLRRYLDRFDVAQTFSKDEDIEHWFISGMGKDVDGKREGQVVWAYVVEDPETHKVTDMVSFYSLPSSIMKHPKHNVLNSGYLFYYASDTIFSAGGSGDDQAKAKLDARLNALVNDLLVVAQTEGFDVLNALTILDNNMFLSEQKFGAGDGFLNYYLYNWHTAPVEGGMQGTVTRQSSGVGVVML